MRKEIPFVTLVVVFLLTGIVPVQADLKPNVVVSGFSIKEGSATVGKDFTLVLALTNLEPTACAKTLTTTVQAGAPFIMRGVSTILAGDLCTGSIKEVDFPMRIDPTATGGFYQLMVTNNYETATLAQFSSSTVINLLVNGTPQMQAYLVKSNPLDVYPGDTATLTLSVQNDGTFQAQSVTASLRAERPLEVGWSKSFEDLGLLEAKQGKTADFSIKVPKDAPATDYQLTLEVRYEDENLVRSIKDFAFVFHVAGKAMFETSDAGSDVLYANENSKLVRLLLQNTGTEAAREIKVRMLPQFPFSTDGSVRYMQVLEPGKTGEVQFTVNIDKDATPGTYGLDMLLDFEDAQGKSLQDTAKVSLVVAQKGLFRRFFLDYWFVWVAVIVVLALVLMRIVRGRKRKK